MAYQTALAAVCVEGILFIILAVTGLRLRLIRLVPKSIMLATSAGRVPKSSVLTFVSCRAKISLCILKLWSNLHIDVETSHEGRLISKLHGRVLQDRLGTLPLLYQFARCSDLIVKMRGLACTRSHGWVHVLLSLPILLSRNQNVQSATMAATCQSLPTLFSFQEFCKT